ncbi:hypothetical protein NC653_023569 [Populus alba x Populus x berolinensis]|nr:hypothetical protein NC653_023569 [Populus alba x Populus x berolinensis]
MRKSYSVSKKSLHRKVVDSQWRDRPCSLSCLAELQSEKGQAASWKVALPVYGGARDHLTFGRSVGVDSIWVVVLWLSLFFPEESPMAPPPGPYSGTSTLALVARVSAFSLGLVYGSVKLKYLQAKAKSQKKAEAKAKAHH